MYLLIFTDYPIITSVSKITNLDFNNMVSGDLKIVAFKDGKYYELDSVYLEWKEVK